MNKAKNKLLAQSALASALMMPTFGGDMAASKASADMGPPLR